MTTSKKTDKTAKVTKKATKATKAVAKVAKVARRGGVKVSKPTVGKKMAPPKGGVAEVPARGHSVPRLWALGAYVAAREMAARGFERWDAADAEAARVLLLRADGVAASPSDEVMGKARPRPVGFTTWKAAAARLRDPAFALAHRGAGERKGSFQVSPYAVTIAMDPKHEFFDPRGLLTPTPSMIASIGTVGVLDQVKLAQLVEGGLPILYVADGRQRVAAVLEWNRRQLGQWWGVGSSEMPPELIVSIPAERLDGGVKEAQRAGGVLNAAALRRADSLRDLAHRVPQLRASGYTREEISETLGLSAGTVSNLLSLQKLAPRLEGQLWSDRLAPACAYILATQDAEHQVALWDVVSRLPAPRRAQHLKELISAEARVTEAQTAVDYWTKLDSVDGISEQQRGLFARAREQLTEAEEALARLEEGGAAGPRKAKPIKVVHEVRRRIGHLGGEGPRLIGTVLDYVLGAGELDLDGLLAELASSPSTTVQWQSIVCPDCLVDPGENCVSDDGEPMEPCKQRLEAAKMDQALKYDAAGQLAGVSGEGQAKPSTVDGPGVA